MWTESTPLWVGIVEVLREFPRTIETIQFGLEQYHGWQVPADVVTTELLKLASEGFIALTDSHADGLCGYKLTHNGLLLQASQIERCPHDGCYAELVMGGEDGWRVCGNCERLFWMRTSDTDETIFHRYTGAAAMQIFDRLPKVPEEIPTCRPVPRRDSPFANG